MKFRSHTVLAVLAACLMLAACAPKVSLFGASQTDPLQEMVVAGEGEGKVALIHLRGLLRSQARPGTFTDKPSQVQELVSALSLAEYDEQVKGVIIAIDSPGGTITASDIIYHELLSFKERTGKKVVAAMIDVAASGGYYSALPADWIMAHPTTITGSVGVIFMRPKVTDLLDKIGVDVEVNKSGKDKDMGSPYRPTSPEEDALFQALIDSYAARFHMLVDKHRSLSPDNMELVKTARVFTAESALEVGLIDEIGYLDDVFAKARELSGLGEDAMIVTYRRNVYPNDNAYNTMMESDAARLNLLGADAGLLLPPKAGFYYAWPQGLAQ